MRSDRRKILFTDVSQSKGKNDVRAGECVSNLRSFRILRHGMILCLNISSHPRALDPLGVFVQCPLGVFVHVVNIFRMGIHSGRSERAERPSERAKIRSHLIFKVVLRTLSRTCTWTCNIECEGILQLGDLGNEIPVDDLNEKIVSHNTVMPRL